MSPARAAGAFARATDRLFAHFGEEAVLRSGEPVVAIVSENVAVIGEYGEVAQTVTTATLMSAAGAKVGDALTVAGKAWKIDAMLRSDGQASEFVVRPA